MKFNIEEDFLGKIEVPADKYWGAQTQRSLQNFKIGKPASMPYEIIEAYAYIKKGAALVNHELGDLPENKKKLIVEVCDEIISGQHVEHFPLVVWQTGSGTHTNMNCNEVIANRAIHLQNERKSDKILIHPNDDVNKSQSTNDTFSSAMHIAALKKISSDLIPSLTLLRDTLKRKSLEFWDIIKTGRTHLMDATPIRLGQEFLAYATQLNKGIKILEDTYPELGELAIGGTAVGTGINSSLEYNKKIARCIAELTGLPFTEGINKPALMAGHEAIVQAHAGLKQLATSLTKIANDIRMMASGPRTGLGELTIPAKETGSSIMPGKVNPTQIEALLMVCARIIGNDVTITIANSSGQFELNTLKPVMIYCLLESITLLSDACKSFSTHCVSGIEANQQHIESNVNKSLMLVTQLTPHIGYKNAEKISLKAFKEGITLKEAGISLGLITESEYDEWVVPEKMIAPRE
ncbi:MULTISPECIES: class II fumarate hydratase [unclassified Saccharicrinis]|uniref:class II fumarate hydratase n=1 Tax=unclassified Saccharicrinis TaxID=2646859 RepID=UPI003D325ED6